MAQSAAVSTTSGAETKVKDAVDNLRSAAQDLHKQIGDALSKKSGATKADLAALAEKTRGVIQSAKASIDTQKGNVGKHLTDAVKHLEATQAHLSFLLFLDDAPERRVNGADEQQNDNDGAHHG